MLIDDIGGVYSPTPTATSAPAAPPPEPVVFEEPKVEYLVDLSPEPVVEDWELAGLDLIAANEAAGAAPAEEPPAPLEDWELAAHDLIAANEAAAAASSAPVSDAEMAALDLAFANAAGAPAEAQPLPDWELAAHDLIAANEAAASAGSAPPPPSDAELAGLELMYANAAGNPMVGTYAQNVGFNSSGGTSSNWGTAALNAVDTAKQGVSTSQGAFDFSTRGGAPRAISGASAGWGALDFLRNQNPGEPTTPQDAAVNTLSAVAAAGDAQDLARAIRPSITEIPQLTRASGVASGGLAVVEGVNQLRLADGDNEQKALGALKVTSGVLMMMAPIPVIGQGAFIAGSGLYTGVMLYENRETIESVANGVPDWAYAIGMSMPGVNVMAMAGLGIKHADDLADVGGALKNGAGKLNPFD